MPGMLIAGGPQTLTGEICRLDPVTFWQPHKVFGQKVKYHLIIDGRSAQNPAYLVKPANIIQILVQSRHTIQLKRQVS